MHFKQKIACFNLVLCLFVFFPLHFSYAEAEETVYTQKDLAGLRKAYDSSGKKSKTGAVILLKDQTVHIGQDGSMIKTIHVVGDVFDDKAASDYGQMGFYFDSYYENMELEFAHTVQENGKIIPVSENAIQVRSDPQEYEIERYSNYKLYTFTFPALIKGSSFEFKLRISKKPQIEHHWFDRFEFNFVAHNPSKFVVSRIDPVFLSRLTLNSTGKIIYDLQGPKTKPRLRKTGARDEYQWEISQLEGISLEPEMPSLSSNVSCLTASSIDDWQKIDHWVNKKFSGKADPDPKISRLAMQLTKGIEDQYEKIYQIARFVHSNIKYVSAHLNRDGYEPHSNLQTLEHRYGDCKDQVMLILSLLKAVGIKAFPVLINPGSDQVINWNIPHLSFSHAMVYISVNGKDIFVDTASNILLFPFLDWESQGKKVFVVDGKGGRIITTPEMSADGNISKITKEFKFNGDQYVINTRLQVTGPLSQVYKHYLSAYKEEERLLFLLEQFDYKESARQHIKKVFIDNSNSPGSPLNAGIRMAFDYSPVEFDPTLVYESDILIFKFFPELSGLFDIEKRKNDYVLRYPRTLISEWICHSPAQHFTPKLLPENQLVQTDYFLLSRKVEQKESSVNVTAVLSINNHRVEKSNWQAFKKSLEHVKESWQWKLVFENKFVEDSLTVMQAEAEKDPNDVGLLLKISKYYINNGEYEKALNIIKRAQSIAPENGELYYYKGVAEGFSDLFEASEKSFKRAKTLGYKP